MENKLLYRKHPALHELEPFYSRHVSAMTTEALHGKSDIAAELAFRDKKLAVMQEEIKNLRFRLEMD